LDTGQISKADVYKLNVFFLDVCKDFCRILKHISPVFQMMVASNQPIGFLAFEAVLYGLKSMPQRAKVHNRCVTAMLKNLGLAFNVPLTSA
jgi:hypothetical protein